MKDMKKKVKKRMRRYSKDAWDAPGGTGTRKEERRYRDKCDCLTREESLCLLGKMKATERRGPNKIEKKLAEDIFKLDKNAGKNGSKCLMDLQTVGNLWADDWVRKRDVEAVVKGKIINIAAGCNDFHWCGKKILCQNCREKIRILEDICWGKKLC